MWYYIAAVAQGGGDTRAGLETGGAAGAGSPLNSNEWNQMLRTDGARRSETGTVTYAVPCSRVWVYGHWRHTVLSVVEIGSLAAAV